MNRTHRLAVATPFVLGLCACALGSGGERPADAARARCVALVERALDENRAIALLADLVAAAPMRLSGSSGNADAVEWGLRTMRELGLQNVRAEPCLVPHWERGVETAAIVGDGEPLRVTALGGSIGTPTEGIEAEVVEVRSFEQLQQLGDAARGKLVFFNRPMPRALRAVGQAYGEAVPQRSNGAIEAGKVGALGAIVRSMTTALDTLPHTGAMHYDPQVPQVPAAAIATLDAERLHEALQRGPVRVRLQLGCRQLPDAPGANVVGELVGSAFPEKVVVVGGHLDAWDLGQGAHDDGAGCVHALEAVRLLQACGIRPRCTIRVVLYANEENGLRGARAYADAHRDELRHHIAALESDSGGFAPSGILTSLRDDAAAAMRAALAPLQDHGAGTFLPGAGACGADIGPLHDAGVPCFGLHVGSQRYFDHHHAANDTLEAVDDRELALGAAVVAFTLSVLADG